MHISQEAISSDQQLCSPIEACLSLSGPIASASSATAMPLTFSGPSVSVPYFPAVQAPYPVPSMPAISPPSLVSPSQAPSFQSPSQPAAAPKAVQTAVSPSSLPAALKVQFQDHRVTLTPFSNTSWLLWITQVNVLPDATCLSSTS